MLGQESEMCNNKLLVPHFFYFIFIFIQSFGYAVYNSTCDDGEARKLTVQESVSSWLDDSEWLSIFWFMTFTSAS